ncbi:DeoR/GlpR transcriptional regulator [Actinospica durhamensis]|uniref:Lactose phosphotransferase system repressor n=1 Tax=Actinospica durhamensis TaxID=1508375 RepID=A0A941EZZ5_9ACTN|nr:DeoR/GlpR family DNA-binding transcription regulator [Actinospica durhamensis]MBR7838584.1 DeoR/GlpR transcriptional regulator [Actinospica durhamensis]
MGEAEELLAAVLPEERRLRIAALLRRDTRVRVEELADRFAVSGETVRRDLKVLEDRGLARRVYGGAVAVGAGDAAAAGAGAATVEGGARRSAGTERDGREARRAIASAAAGLVEPGETLMFGIGGIVAETARALPLTFTGRALCASVPAATALAARAGVEVHLAGGLLRRPDLACTDDAAARFFDRFFARRAFLAGDGVDARAGLTCAHLDEVPVRRALIRQAAECYVLADAAKLGAVAVGRVAALAELAGIITDEAADPEIVQALEHAGARVLIAPPLPRLD